MAMFPFYAHGPLGRLLRASSVRRPVLPATVTAGISEPGVRANGLATRPVMERVPSKVLPLSAFFSSLTWEFVLPLLYWQEEEEEEWSLCRSFLVVSCLCRGRLPGAGLDPPPASSALPFAGLPANAAPGSEYKEWVEDALTRPYERRLGAHTDRLLLYIYLLNFT